MAGDKAQPWARGCSDVRDSGPLNIAAAALFISFISLFIKLLYGRVSALEVTFISSVVCLVVTTLVAVAHPRGLLMLIGSSPQNRMLLLLRGVLGALALMFYYTSIEILPMQEAVSIFFCNPVFAVVFHAIRTRTAIPFGSLLGCGLMVLGMSLMTHPTCRFSASDPIPAKELVGIGFGVAAAAGIAASFEVIHRIGPSESSITLSWWYHATVVVMSGVATFSPLFAAPVLPSPHEWWLLGGITAIHFVGQLLLNRGFKLSSASYGAAINASQVVFSYLWHVVILHRGVRRCSLLGSGCIIASVVLVTLTHRPEAEPEPQAEEEATLDEDEPPVCDTYHLHPILTPRGTNISRRRSTWVEEEGGAHRGSWGATPSVDEGLIEALLKGYKNRNAPAGGDEEAGLQPPSPQQQ